MRKGDSWVMISTEVMARGMDFQGVREVINYDFPTSVQSYIHRIGELAKLYGRYHSWTRNNWQGVRVVQVERVKLLPFSLMRMVTTSKRMTVSGKMSLLLTLDLRIANVLLQSGSQVPDWILKLPKPSKTTRRSMGRIKHLEFVNPARKIGRKDAIRKRFLLPHTQ